jgi:phage gpG-like protein
MHQKKRESGVSEILKNKIIGVNNEYSRIHTYGGFDLLNVLKS